MCPYERYIINDATLIKQLFLFVRGKFYSKNLGKACVGRENLVPIAVPDICCLVLKTFP